MCPVVYDDQIKAPNLEINYTPEQISELIKCSQDILYFLKYVKIVTRNGRDVFNPYQFQLDLLKTFQENRHIVAKVARQSGKCVSGDTKIKIRSKITGEEKEIAIEDFYKELKQK